MRTIDIFPTVLEGVGLRSPSEGWNLFAANADNASREELEFAFGESGDSLFPGVNPCRYIEGLPGKWRIARTTRWKLIYIPHPESPVFEFYNLVNDLGETVNLIDEPEHEARIETFKDALFAWIRPEDLKADELTQPADSDPEVDDRLRSLGYIE